MAAEAASANEKWLEERLQGDRDFDERAEPVCILFADLDGATAFKCRHSSIEGLDKVYTHNRCVQEIVESAEFEGEVARFMGDGVLAFFEGENAAKRGMHAALAIVRRIWQENDERKWTFPKAMFTRIGLDYGPVWMMQFKTASTRDPQGTTVDVAARLASLAESSQVLTTEETFRAAGGEEVFANYRLRNNCTIRGILQPRTLVVVAGPDDVLKEISLPGGFSSTDLTVQTQLDFAAAHWQAAQEAEEYGDRARATEELIASMNEYESVLDKDPLNFDANFHLAEHLALHWRDSRTKRIERLKRAQRLLQIATSERPDAAYGWMLLSWVRFRLYHGRGCEETVILKEAIGYVRHALHIADSRKDDYGAAVARIYLIVYLYFLQKCNDQSDEQRNEVVQEAVQHSEQARATIDAGLEKRLKSQLIMGEALTGLISGKLDQDEALGMLDRARGEDRYNRVAAEMITEVMDGVDPGVR